MSNTALNQKFRLLTIYDLHKFCKTHQDKLALTEMLEAADEEFLFQEVLEEFKSEYGLTKDIQKSIKHAAREWDIVV